MNHEQPAANFKERLPIPFGQFVQNDPPGGISQCLEYVTHTPRIGKQ